MMHFDLHSPVRGDECGRRHTCIHLEKDLVLVRDLSLHFLQMLWVLRIKIVVYIITIFYKEDIQDSSRKFNSKHYIHISVSYHSIKAPVCQ